MFLPLSSGVCLSHLAGLEVEDTKLARIDLHKRVYSPSSQ